MTKIIFSKVLRFHNAVQNLNKRDELAIILEAILTKALNIAFILFSLRLSQIIH